jgi:ubiquinone/menaquinone biosynthesis C-methylase UbiE
LADEDLDVYERIYELFRHLGLSRAHVAAHQWPGDWQGLAADRTDLLASLTLAGGLPANTATLEDLSAPLFVFCGEGGPSDRDIEPTLRRCPDASALVLDGYSRDLWDDIVADRLEDIAPAWQAFLDRVDATDAVPHASCKEVEGTCAGLRYQVRGSGPPLVIFPLGLAKSQWEPLLARLSARYCTVTVRGPHLGPAAVLEGRAKSRGYLEVVDRVVEAAHPQPGDRVLEVGSGTGAITRWMAANRSQCSFTGVDVNTYLLAEAEALASTSESGGSVEFKEGNAESLPFPDKSFDVVLSFTVLEELDVDQALAEMRRVTKPGGRVGVLVRSVDTHVVVNLPLRTELRQKVEAPPRWWGGVGAKGCADRSLYQRFSEAGLADVQSIPQLATYTDRERLEGLYPQFAALLDGDEVGEWWSAVESATAAGSVFISQPMHSAVGTRT